MENQFQCDICLDEFSSQNDLEEHHLINHGLFASETLDQLDEHQQHSAPAKCNLCGSENVYTVQEGQVYCLDCQLTDEQPLPPPVTTTQAIVTPPITTANVGVVSDVLWGVDDFNESTLADTQVNYDPFLGQTAMSNPLPVHVTTVDPFITDLGVDQTLTADLGHVLGEDILYDSEEEVEPEKDLYVYHCMIAGCDKKYKTATGARLHSRVPHYATPEKPYKCDKCFKSFKLKESLREHVQAEHENIPKHKCDEPGCNKSYGYERLLHAHKKKIHKSSAETGASTTAGNAGTVNITQAGGIITRPVLTGTATVPTTTTATPRIITRSATTRHVLPGTSIATPLAFKCQSAGCNQMFSSHAELKQHIQADHKRSGKTDYQTFNTAICTSTRRAASDNKSHPRHDNSTRRAASDTKSHPRHDNSTRRAGSDNKSHPRHYNSTRRAAADNKNHPRHDNSTRRAASDTKSHPRHDNSTRRAGSDNTNRTTTSTPTTATTTATTKYVSTTTVRINAASDKRTTLISTSGSTAKSTSTASTTTFTTLSRRTAPIKTDTTGNGTENELSRTTS